MLLLWLTLTYNINQWKWLSFFRRLAQIFPLRMVSGSVPVAWRYTVYCCIWPPEKHSCDCWDGWQVRVVGFFHVLLSDLFDLQKYLYEFWKSWIFTSWNIVRNKHFLGYIIILKLGFSWWLWLIYSAYANFEIKILVHQPSLLLSLSLWKTFHRAILLIGALIVKICVLLFGSWGKNHPACRIRRFSCDSSWPFVTIKANTK